jgi:starch phosphorylase
MLLEIGVALNGLKPDDVVLEMLISRQTDRAELRESRRYRLESRGLNTEQGEHRFALQVTPEMCGKLEYRVRIYPYHDLLTHPFEMGMMRWL